MKKNRDNVRSDLVSSDPRLKRRASGSILVFLVLGLILLAVNLFPSPSYPPGQESSTSPAPPAKDQYVWLTGTGELKEGLYLLTPALLEDIFPDSGQPDGETFAKSALPPRVSAIRINAGGTRPIALPPEVANIFSQPIPINRADKDILGALPGIGPVLAERIIQRRMVKGPFSRKDELLHIAGIGPKKLARLADHIVID